MEKDSIEVRKTTRGEAEHAFVHRHTEAVLGSLKLARLSVCFFISFISVAGCSASLLFLYSPC